MINEQNPTLDESSQSDLNIAFADFLAIYTPDPQAKDTMIASIETKFQKPNVVQVQTHFNCIIYYLTILISFVEKELKN